MKEKACIVVAVVGAVWLVPAHAYRPFGGTDADVLDRGELELELGYSHYLREGSQRSLFARYSLVGTLVGALGTLFAGLPDIAVAATHISVKAALQTMFGLYALVGILSAGIYWKLPVRRATGTPANDAPLKGSRRTAFTLAALFSLDSFGGGFVVQSLLALWLFEKYQLSALAAGSIFFWTGVLSALSYLVAVRWPTGLAC